MNLSFNNVFLLPIFFQRTRAWRTKVAELQMKSPFALSCNVLKRNGEKSRTYTPIGIDWDDNWSDAP